jgi:hypothetical protein
MITYMSNYVVWADAGFPGSGPIYDNLAASPGGAQATLAAESKDLINKN